jgi:hypothetical protein
MPYDPGPQRRIKAQAMVDTLGRAAATHTPPRTWSEVAEALVRYSVGDWRQLSVASGRPDRNPSPETRAEVVGVVQGLAAAQ